ncbi:MAG TPA: hypothetical protein VGT08_15335 [Terracidiphilus sp.]|nr:hypothetical protein [Terracidiphilus sp.]
MQKRIKNGWCFDPDDLTAREAVIIALGLLLIFRVFVSFGHNANLKFGGLTISTLILFGYFVHGSRKYVRHSRFWSLTASLLALHLLLWIALLSHVEKWGPLWFYIMVFELPVFWHLRDRPGLLD